MADVKSEFNARKSKTKYVLLIVAAVLLVVWGVESPPGVLGKADAIGYAVCHRIDTRSFHIDTQQLPLCARCTGQYIGAVIGLVFQAVFSRRRAGFPPRRFWIILGLLCVIYIVDGLNSYLYLPPFLEVFPRLPHLYVPTNAIRLFTGSGMGLIIAALLYPALIGTIYTHPDHRPALGDIKTVLFLLGLGLLADLLILIGSSLILYLAALISAIGVVILLSFAYTIVILRIFKKENTYEHFSQITSSLFAGFLLTMAQIALFDLIRFIITGTWSGFTF